jgi:hypothetical protein
MTKILLYKYFIRKYYLAQMIFHVFSKHPPAHKESIGILGDQIRPWEVLEKSGHTDRQTSTGTSANYYIDIKAMYVRPQMCFQKIFMIFLKILMN